MFATSGIVVFVSVVLVAGSPVGLPNDQVEDDVEDLDLSLLQTPLKRLARHVPLSIHIFDHILHEVERGHVTSVEMHHWREEINHALEEGELTKSDVNTFMHGLRERLPNSQSTDWCCIFG